MKADQKQTVEKNIKNTRLLIVFLALTAAVLGGLQFAFSKMQFETHQQMVATQLPTTQPTIEPSPTLPTPTPTSLKLVEKPNSQIYSYPQYGYRIQIPTEINVTETKVRNGVWLKMSYEGVSFSVYAGKELTQDVRSDMTTYKKVSPILFNNLTWETYELNVCGTPDCKDTQYVSVYEKETTAFAMRYSLTPEVGKTLLNQIEITDVASTSAAPKPSPTPSI